MIYHFIGIKGTGMGALAQFMFDLGYNVQGSDKTEHFFTEDALVEKGIKIFCGYIDSFINLFCKC